MNTHSSTLPSLPARSRSAATGAYAKSAGPSHTAMAASRSARSAPTSSARFAFTSAAASIWIGQYWTPMLLRITNSPIREHGIASGASDFVTSPAKRAVSSEKSIVLVLRIWVMEN